MNKSFKVVFNKARGTLMVVNEVTSSVQKHSGSIGTKTLIAASIAGLMCATSQANIIVGTQWTDTVAPKAVDLTLNENKVTAQDEASGLYVNKATGTQNNVSVHFDVLSNKKPASSQIYNTWIRCDNNVTFAGDTLTLSTTTDYTGTGNNQVSGLYIDPWELINGTWHHDPKRAAVNVTAKKTDIFVESKAKEGKSVYGIASSGILSLTGDVVNITVKSATVRQPDNQYSHCCPN